ncbi:MAG: SHOCT domain-containing protein [Dehalococcoidia bacterium]|nr:SHOCT domain-containing protein [Dehalococcoidia bacterium]
MMGGSWGLGIGNFMGGFWMFIIWIAIIGLIVWAVTAAVRPGQNTGHASGSSAQDIARSRYARGEINKEQYEQLRKDLV